MRQTDADQVACKGGGCCKMQSEQHIRCLLYTSQVPVLVLEMGLGRNKIVSWGPVNEWLKDKEQ